MNVYMINFADNTTYIGATSGTVKNRVSNHISKYKSGKYQNRKIYQKMGEFNCNFEYKTLKVCKTDSEMHETEISYIALLKGENLLNNSTGGKYSSTGKTVYNKCNKTNPMFKMYCAKTKKLLYHGKDFTECSNISGCSVGTISTALKKIKSGVVFKNHRNNRKFIFTLTGGDLSL